MDNTLYYGDNLDILKRYIPDERDAVTAKSSLIMKDEGRWE